MQMATHILQVDAYLKFARDRDSDYLREDASEQPVQVLGNTISGGAAISTPENSMDDQLIYGTFVLAIWVSRLWRSYTRKIIEEYEVLQDELLQVFCTREANQDLYQG